MRVILRHQRVDLEVKIGHLETVVVYFEAMQTVKFSGSRLIWLLLTFSCLIIGQFLELKTSCF